MKKALLTLALVALCCLSLACIVSAQTVYLEEIPSDLKVNNDTATHFVVFEEEKYFTGNGNTITGLNSDEIAADMTAAGIDATKIGTEYLTRFNFPAYLNGTLITYVNLNSVKTNGYFRNVCGYIQLEGTVNKIHDMNQCTSQLRCIDFGENSQIKEIPSHFANSSGRLLSVKNFPRDLNSIGDNAFNKCYGAFHGELYLNAKTIGPSAFNNAISFVTGLVFGPNTKSIANQALCVRLSEFNLKPEDNKPMLTYIEFQCDVSAMSFAPQGNDQGSIYFTGGNARTPYSKVKCIILSHPNNQVTDGAVFNDFIPGDLGILLTDNDYTDDFVKSTHGYVDTGVSYDSFLEGGKKTSACTDCGAVSCVALPAIFTFKGYSVSMTGIAAITVGFEVNRDALSAYEAATDSTLEFGIIAASANNLGSSSPLDEIGQPTTLASGKVIKAPIKSTHDFFVGKLVGLSTSEHKATGFVLCGYIQELDTLGNLNISYMQNKQCDASGITAIAYNDFIAE